MLCTSCLLMTSCLRIMQISVAEWLARLDCGARGPRFDYHTVFIATAAAICSLGHRLCTFSAVSKSTQPSIIRGTVKWVSAYGLSNNNNGDGGCGR